MARNEEKALTLFNRWQTFKKDFHAGLGCVNSMKGMMDSHEILPSYHILSIYSSRTDCIHEDVRCGHIAKFTVCVSAKIATLISKCQQPRVWFIMTRATSSLLLDWHNLIDISTAYDMDASCRSLKDIVGIETSPLSHMRRIYIVSIL